jgi:hypothetical protein
MLSSVYCLFLLAASSLLAFPLFASSKRIKLYAYLVNSEK